VLGRWDEALARAAEAEELAPTEFQRGLLMEAVSIHCYRGALDRARELLARNADIGRSENPDFSGGYAVLEARVLAVEGRAEEAARKVKLALEAHRKAGATGWEIFQGFEVSAVLSDPDEIRTLLGSLDGLGVLSPSLEAQQARFRARLPEYDADAELSTAEEIFHRLEAPFYLAVVQLEHAEWLARQGRAVEAERLLAEAREVFERLEARPWLERASAPAAGARVPA